MKARNYQQCNRCVMDTTDLKIIFDKDGICNHCTDFLTRKIKFNYQGKSSDRAIERIVKEIKLAGKNSDYDCIIGLSGGVDSSYSAYVAKELGLRILGVHMDNGWNSEQAVLNIKNVVNKLGIDYDSYVLDWEEFKDLQLAFLKASVPEAETPTDMAIPAACYQYAAKYNVKYIISGGNFATEGILPTSWHYNAKDMKYFSHIQKTFGEKKLKTFPTFGFKKEMYYKIIKGIKMVYLLNYVPFNKEEAMEFLKTNLDWKFYGGKHYESKYTKFIQSYYLYEKFGIDYRRATLSSQICVGEAFRDESLKQLKSKPYKIDNIAQEKQYIVKKLQISQSELEEIISSQPKWFWNYPNDFKKLNFIYDSYRKIFKKEKLGNF